MNLSSLLVAPYTEEEMQILNIPLDKRDYCAHYFRAIMICYTTILAIAIWIL